MAHWIDLIDPTPEELRAQLPRQLQGPAVELLFRPAEHTDEPRPTLQAHGDYIWGVFLVAIAVPEEDRVFYQEIDAVVTHDVLLTVSKTPPGEHPYDPRPVRESCSADDNGGMMLYRLVDDIAEHYLGLVDDLDGEIDQLEDSVEAGQSEITRRRLSELRHDLLRIRRTLSPTRDAVRRVVDNVIEVREGPEVFPHEVEISFNGAYDKLLRASDGLELSRDLINGVRDYLQTKIANDQNEVTKRLTAIASLLLVPTFIVGVYGQNFRYHFPEIHWQYGYYWSWALIIASTVAQFVWFRRRRWI